MKFARLFFLLLVLALAAPGAANAEHEPNNGLWQAEGPIAGGVDVQGALTTDNDIDWYVFYARPQQEIHLTSEGGCDVSLLDTDGSYLPSDYTTPSGAAERYFVKVEWDYCSDYSFRVDPVTAVTTGPAMPTPTPTAEPNESNSQAVGPLVGGTTYSGTLATSNDQDWFYFWTTPGTHQLDLSATGVNGCTTVELFGPGAPEDDWVEPEQDTIGHITLTVTGRHRYAVRVEGCLGADWQFRIDGAVGPPPVCTAERARYAAAERALSRAQRALDHAHSRKARRSARRKRRAARTEETRAADALNACIGS